jgi:glutathione S-transferase
MKLYYMPTTRAVRPRWLLEELDIPYELVNVNIAMTQKPEYLHLHPQGKVPILVDGDVTIYESSAICAYLADKYLERGFAPPLAHPNRSYYYQWLFYAGQTLEPPVEQYMFKVLPNLPEKILPKEYKSHLELTVAKDWFDRVCQPLNTTLTDRDYLVDNRISAADIVIGGVLLWALKLGMMTTDSPVKTYLSRLMARPAFTKADENVYASIEPT